MSVLEAPSAPSTSASASGLGRSAQRPVPWIRERGMGATMLVSGISSAFGVVLISATGFIAAALRADPYIGDSGTLAVVIGILSALLLGVAVYVGAIVTANTFSTIVAGRTRRIALLRLIGASARSQRAEVSRQGLIVGVAGSVTGLVAATAVLLAAMPWVGGLLGVDVDYAVVRPALLVPAAAVALTTWIAAWAGSRRVLSVTPLQALGGSVEASHDDISTRRGRHVVAVVLGAIGVVLLAGGLLVGLVTPLGVVIAFFGGLFSFTGLTMAAPLVMPPLLRLTGRLFGSSTAARLAAENATRYPERSSRMAIGVVMGVALVTMFAVATETVQAITVAASGGAVDAQFAQVLDTFSTIMMALVGVSAVIAAVGLVNLLTIGVVQRRRELGLLRALGLTSPEVRRMVLLEAAHIVATSLAFGLVLGVLYGWVAAQATLGSVSFPPLWTSPSFVAPAIPLVPVLVVIAATVVLTLVAAVVPTRLATRATAVEAIADSRD